MPRLEVGGHGDGSRFLWLEVERPEHVVQDRRRARHATAKQHQRHRGVGFVGVSLHRNAILPGVPYLVVFGLGVHQVGGTTFEVDHHSVVSLLGDAATENLCIVHVVHVPGLGVVDRTGVVGGTWTEL